MNKLKMHSPDLTQANIDKLAALFPNCVAEARGADGVVKRSIDFDQLRQELSTSIVEGPQERYQLNWPGKREALLTANAPIAKTLRPCREESVDFDTTQNLFIEGDNLDALKLLQETYLNKVKLIYIDPPYNTGNDFIYEDDFAENSKSYFQRSNQTDELGNRLVANSDTNGRRHSDWLTMIYARIRLARNFLSDDGVIFISIDDHEVQNLRKICDEVFGEDNFIGQFVINSSPSAIDYGHIAKMHDYVLFYAKDLAQTTSQQLEEEDKEFKYSDETGNFNIYPLYNGNVAFNPKTRPNLYYPFYLDPNSKIGKHFFEISLNKTEGWEEVYPVVSRKDGIQRVWRWGRDKSRLDLNKEIVGYKTDEGEYRVVQKSRHTGKVIRSLLIDKEISSRRGTAAVEELFGAKVFSFPKSVELIRRFVAVATDTDSIVMDFFSGSATTAHAVFQQNAHDQGERRFILVQLPEVCDEESTAFKSGYRSITDISKERIRRAGTKIRAESAITAPNLDVGFRVLKVDTSNMSEVFYTPDAVNQDQLAGMVNNIREDRTAEDLLFQVLLDWGVDLALPITTETIAGKTVFFVDGNALAACFEEGISEEFVKLLAQRTPLRAVFRDAGFASDSVKINVEQIFKLMSPGTEVKTI